MSFIGSIEDRLEIHELVMSYGHAVTIKSSKEWGDTWSKDSVWEIPVPGMDHIEGKENIVNSWIEAMMPYKQIVFKAWLGTLEVKGDYAKGITYTNELGTDLKDQKTRVDGRYEDEFIREDGKWLFKKRSFSILHMD
jgi:hypothetical protein